MKRLLGMCALVAAAGLLPALASASGSIGAGGGIGPRNAYAQGKALTFQKLVCADCPVQPSELDRARAQSLKDSLEARNAEAKPGTPDDENIQVLCPGSRGGDCAGAADEQELVHYFLSRRFKL